MPHSAAPPAPPAAREVFGDAFSLAERYAGLLAGPGVDRGLIGPREVERLWERHLLNCAVVGELVPERSQLVDVGSGAGLPGLVLAIIRPDLRVTLLEPMLRRATFLDECVVGLELDNVQVHRARAEDEAERYAAEMVTARAVAALDRLVAWTLPLLRPGGQLLALKGERAEAELAAARPVLREFGVRSAEVLHIGHSRVVPPTTVVRVVSGRTQHRGGGHRVRPGGQRSSGPRKRGSASRGQGQNTGQAQSKRRKR